MKELFNKMVDFMTFVEQHMKKPFYKKSDFLAIIISFLSIIVVIIGAYLNWVFISRSTVELNQANTRNLNTVTDKLNSQTSEILGKMTVIEKQANIVEKKLELQRILVI
jgi:hypothetical protein